VGWELNVVEDERLARVIRVFSSSLLVVARARSGGLLAIFRFRSLACYCDEAINIWNVVGGAGVEAAMAIISSVLGMVRGRWL